MRHVTLPSTTLKAKLDHLSNLSGLTCFEREFVARLRAYQKPIPDREMSVLDRIWHVQGGIDGQ
ncbi:MAG: hypothetical protein WCA35_21100, partial [Kovacikia sp.]